MGILDEAIKDHLDLKRRRGTDEPELKRLEDEAFGPPGRPDATGADAAIASALAAPPAEPSITELPSEDPSGGGESTATATAPASETPAPEAPAPEAPAPEAPPAPAPDTAPEDEPRPSRESEGGSAFHDFAAEEGLVEADVADAPDEKQSTGERAVAEALGGDSSAPVPTEDAAASETEDKPPSPDAAETPPPGQEDTQVHDMAKELGLDDDAEPGSGSSASQAPESADATSLDRIELDDLDLELESEAIDVEADEIEIAEPETGDGEDDSEGNDEPGDGEDVLEETPEFLRDAPESDRLWFEQGKPKDFDFDDEDE